MMSSGGYSNDEHRSDGPPRNVLSQETVRMALAQAGRSASSNSIKSSSGHRSSQGSPPRPGSVRRTATGSSQKSSHGSCDCLDCRDLSARESYGKERIDPKTGDRIREHDGDDDNLPLHLHGVRDDEQRPAGPRRTSTNSSSSSRSRGSNKNITTTRDREGNLEQSWAGSEAPKVRTHYDWDAAENQKSFPDAPHPPRRTNTSGSSRHG
ncbi:hypothetical protein EDC01DRAFT_374789 [Geopyxis carbonaria]|nr:hypothetical protein EDC01DRAFT_374789 [Geopyxis carbonaria]